MASVAEIHHYQHNLICLLKKGTKDDKGIQQEFKKIKKSHKLFLVKQKYLLKV